MKILICEQSEEFVDHMVKTIRSYPCDEEIIIESYTDTVGIARRIEKENFDLAYLGGVINGRNGFELGRMIHEKNPACLLIYVCEDYRYMHEGFRAYGFQMVLKPQEKLFDYEFKRALMIYKKLHYHILFHFDNGKTHDFLPSEIMYIVINNDGLEVVTEDRRFKGHFENFKKIQQELMNQHHFFPMHPNYFVNMEYISVVRNGELGMDNGDCVPTSAMNKEIIDDAIQSYMREI